jgi:hypothetical protein
VHLPGYSYDLNTAHEQFMNSTEQGLPPGFIREQLQEETPRSPEARPAVLAP